MGLLLEHEQEGPNPKFLKTILKDEESEKNSSFCGFKEHLLLHLSNLFNESLDLGPPVSAPTHYRSPIFTYNVALKSHIHVFFIAVWVTFEISLIHIIFTKRLYVK